MHARHSHMRQTHLLAGGRVEIAQEDGLEVFDADALALLSTAQSMQVVLQLAHTLLVRLQPHVSIVQLLLERSTRPQCHAQLPVPRKPHLHLETDFGITRLPRRLSGCSFRILKKKKKKVRSSLNLFITNWVLKDGVVGPQ